MRAEPTVFVILIVVVASAATYDNEVSTTTISYAELHRRKKEHMKQKEIDQALAPPKAGDYIDPPDKDNAALPDPEYSEYSDFFQEIEDHLRNDKIPSRRKTKEEQLAEKYGMDTKLRDKSFTRGEIRKAKNGNFTEKDFMPMDEEEYDDYTYGNDNAQEFSTSDLGEYEYSDFAEYFLDAEANEDTMRALKKVWEFNRLHPHHVGYSVRIRDNYAKKKPIPPSWTPEQILKKEILEKREFDEFWHLQEKYYKQPQFCDPYLPCTFRGKLSVGKALANDFFESDFKDGRNVHLQVAGLLSQIFQEAFETYEDTSTSFFTFELRRPFNPLNFEVMFKAGGLSQEYMKSSGVMKRSTLRGLGTTDVLAALNNSLVDGIFLGRYIIRPEETLIAISHPLLKSNRQEFRKVGNGTGGPYVAYPNEAALARVFYIIMFSLGLACFSAFFGYFFMDHHVEVTLKKTETARYETAQKLKKYINKEFFIWTKKDLAYEVYEDMEVHSKPSAWKTSIDTNNVFDQIEVATDTYKKLESIREHKNECLKKRFLAIMPTITQELKTERKAKNSAPSVAAVGMNFVRSSSLRLGNTFKTASKSTRPRRLDLLSRSFRVPKNRDWSKVMGDKKPQMEPFYEVIIHQESSTSDTSSQKSSDAERGNPSKQANDFADTSRLIQIPTKFDRSMVASKSYRLPTTNLSEGAATAEKKVTFDSQDDMAVINTEEPVSSFKRTTSVRLPSLGTNRKDRGEEQQHLSTVSRRCSETSL